MGYDVAPSAPSISEDQMTNVGTVQQIYEAFGRGDVPAILEHLADDVEWEYGLTSTDVPWLQPQHGRTEVPNEASVRSTGRRIVEEDEVHIWHFDRAGKVTRFRHRADTHQHAAAYAAKSSGA
jgi:ketosteroid isomerase-like protein